MISDIPFDSLACAAQRRRGLFHYRRGLPWLGSIFGLQTEPPMISQEAARSFNSDVCEDSFGDPDRYFLRMRCASINELKLTRKLSDPSAFPTFPSPHFPLEKLAAHARQLYEMDDAQLVATISRSFRVEALDLNGTVDLDQFVFIKINHGYWEHLCLDIFRTLDLPYFRPIALDTHARYEKSGFNNLLVLSFLSGMVDFDSVPNTQISRSPKPRLGISFTAGDRPIEVDIRLPLGPLRRGAMIGAHSFLSSFLNRPHFTIVDGAAAKKLVHTNQLQAFIQNIQSNSDIIVFIVPPHLRSIQLRDWHGQTLRVLVPAKYVHELWTVVLPWLASVLSDVMRSGSRISILSQSAVMSVPIGLLVKRLSENLPEPRRNCVRYYDFGQVLDLALGQAQARGPWVQKQASRSMDSPFFVGGNQDPIKHSARTHSLPPLKKGD